MHGSGRPPCTARGKPAQLPATGLVIYFFFFKFLLFQSHDFVFANSLPQGGEAGRGCCSVSVPLGRTDEALPSR